MKQTLLCALLLGVVGVSANAVDIDTDHLMFPEDVNEAIAIAEERAMLGDVRTADQNDYAADKDWVGTTKVDEETQHQQNDTEVE